MVSSDKKREYNKNYREKLRKAKEEQKPDELPAEPVDEAPLIEEDEPRKLEDEADAVVLDKETYEYLIECYKKQHPQEEEKPEEQPKDEKVETPKPSSGGSASFFFQKMKETAVGTIASGTAILALKLAVDGMRYLYAVNRDTAVQSIRLSTQSSQPETSSVMRFVNPE